MTSKTLPAGTNSVALPPSATEAAASAEKATIPAPLTSHGSNTLFICTIDDSHDIKAKRAADEANEATEAEVEQRRGALMPLLE